MLDARFSLFLLLAFLASWRLDSSHKTAVSSNKDLARIHIDLSPLALKHPLWRAMLDAATILVSNPPEDAWTAPVTH